MRRRKDGKGFFSHASQYDSDELIDARTITSNLGESLKMEKSLMSEASFLMPRMANACISWRYFTVVCDDTSQPKDPTAFDSDCYDRIHVFDALAGWMSSSFSGTGGMKLGEEVYLGTPGVYLDAEDEELSDESDN